MPDMNAMRAEYESRVKSIDTTAKALRAQHAAKAGASATITEYANALELVVALDYDIQRFQMELPLVPPGAEFDERRTWLTETITRQTKELGEARNSAKQLEERVKAL